MMVIVFGDSRCRHLHSYLLNADITVYFYPGATLEKVVENAVPIIHHLKPKAVLIMAGDNNVTILHRHPKRILLRFANESEMVHAVISSIERLRRTLHAEFPTLKVSFGGLIGFDLNAMNGIPGYSPSQALITNAFLSLNRAIRDNNVEAGSPHFYATSKVYKSHKGQLRCQYRLLPDGLHPGPAILRDWAKAIKKIWEKDLS